MPLERPRWAWCVRVDARVLVARAADGRAARPSQVRRERQGGFVAWRRGGGCLAGASMSEPTQMFYEDLAVGRQYRGGTVAVTADEVRTFASRYDPQPFHLDPEAGAKSVFGGLVASGWLTASLTMRLMVQSEFRFGSGVVGLGVDSLRWPQPVRPGDVLGVMVEVMAMRTSESKPGFGIVKLKTTTTNQAGETVQVMVSNVLVRRRSAAP